MARVCERSTALIWWLDCVTVVLFFVTMVLACEIPHKQNPLDPDDVMARGALTPYKTGQP